MMDLYLPADEQYSSESFLTLDFEIDTSHGDYGHPVWPDNQMLLACWRVNGRPMKVCWGNELEIGELLEDIEHVDFVVAHNAKYELGWLKRCGLDIGNVTVFDTKIAEYVLSGNLSSLTHYSTSLDQSCIRRGWEQKDPVVDHMISEWDINPVYIPRPWLQGRCMQDVDTTERLFFHQRASLARQGMIGLQYTRCMLTPVLADTEFQGMHLDSERTSAAYADELKEFTLAKGKLDSLKVINWNSDPQKAGFIYGELGFKEMTDRKGKPVRTEGGQPKTDGDTLEKLRGTTKKQKFFVEWYGRYNKAHACLSKNLEFFLGVCDEYDSTFRAVFNQTVTATHRLSSSGVKLPIAQFEGKEKGAQFQNLPNRLKYLFDCRQEDYLFCEWDGSGLEFRGAGLVSKDPMILGDINSGRDPHSFSGSEINKISYDEFIERKKAKDPEVLAWRKDSKEHTFKPLFGGSSGTAAERAYYAAFNQRYSGLISTQEMWCHEVSSTKHFRTPWGLVFRFPYAKRSADGYLNCKTNVYNYPIQSMSTAEIIPLAIVAFWHMVREAGLQDKIIMVNTVHDSVLCEVHKDYLDQYKEFAREAWHYVYWYFENVYRFPLEGLPLGTEITYGSHWTEGDDEAYNIYQDGRVETA